MKNKRAQVLLEVVIVLVSLAVLAVASMRLYSILNLNMTGRLDKYRSSRVSAVNSSVTVNPVDFLDYSPYHNIITPGDGGSDWDFSDIFYQEPRVVLAEQLLNRNDDILNVLLPYKINQAYKLLGEDNNDYDYILRKVSREDAREAKKLIEEIDVLRQEVYDNYYEDMDEAGAFDGVDHDGDGFYGAISLFQQVLYQPVIPGPFDYEDAHQGNRAQFESIINNLTATDTKNALNTLLNDLLKPRIEDVSYNLDLALENWGCCAFESHPNECHCDEIFKAKMGCPVSCRIQYIQEAQLYLKEMVDFLGEMETVPPLAEQEISAKIYDINGLLSEPLLESHVVSAVDDCTQMLSILEAQEAATGNDYSSLKDLVNEIKDEFNSAVSNWDNEEQRDVYIENAKQKLEALEEIAGG